MAITNLTRAERLEIYYEVKRELLREDAEYFTRLYCEDIGLNEDDFDLDELVETYEHREDANSAFNDTWERIIQDYAEDNDLI